MPVSFLSSPDSLSRRGCSPGGGGRRCGGHGAQAAAAAAGPLSLVGGRTVAVLWDLDNMQPSSLALDLVPALLELRELLVGCGAASSSERLIANPATCRRLGTPLRAQLAAARIEVRPVRQREQAADVQLAAEAYSFAREQRGAGCLVCASNDTGFAVPLAYAASLGTLALCLSSFPSARHKPGLLPDPRGRALARACHAALAWRPSAGAAARAARRGRRQGQEGAPGADAEAVGAAAEAVPEVLAGRMPIGPGSGWHVLPAGGFIEAVWLNPAPPGK